MTCLVPALVGLWIGLVVGALVGMGPPPSDPNHPGTHRRGL